MLDLRRLRLLRELEARGTIQAVAHALSYTPSAVSQQLAQLEREAGVPLLERAGRNVHLTDAAVVLARHADVLMRGVEAAEADLAAASQTTAGTIRVAAFQTAMLRLVAPALAAVARDHPAVRVELVEAEVEDALPALRLQGFDLVVGDEYDHLPRPRYPDLEREPLLEEEVRLVLPAAHPLARRRRVPFAKLTDAAWAAAQPGTGHREMVVRTCRALGGFEPDLRHHSNDLLILLELVRSGGAVALLPDLVWAEGDASVVVRRPAEAALHREVFTLTRKGSAARPALAAFMTALRHVAKTPALARLR
jgi:DNA-binding transcriptional LysR family regulator